MKIIKFEDQESWLEARKTKITGSRLGNVTPKERGTGKKIGFYELIAERLAISRTAEKPMDRGHRLEEEAMERFSKETGKKVDPSLVMWVRDDNESIAISPDGVCPKNEAVEVKCLESARHIETYLKQEVPKEYKDQIVQYFVVNDKLKTLYMVFYDPSLMYKDFFFLTISREDIEEDIEGTLLYEKTLLEEVNRIVNELSF